MAERRAQALSLDRDLLRELLGAEELRDLLDGDAMAEVEDELRGRARTPDELHDLLLRRGDLAAGEFEETLSAELEAERRAIRVRIGGLRLIAAEDAGRYREPWRDASRRASGRVPRGGREPTRVRSRPFRPWPWAVHDRRARGALWLRRRSGGGGARPLEQDGRLVRGELRPGGTRTRMVRSRRPPAASPGDACASAKEVEPVDHAALARFLPAWQGVDRKASLREALVPLQGVALPSRSGRATSCPGGFRDTSPRGSISCVPRGGRLGRRRARRVAVFYRDDAPLLGRPGALASPEGEVPERIRAALAPGALSRSGSVGARTRRRSRVARALGSGLGGEVANDAWQPLRARRRYATPRPVQRNRRRFSRQRGDGSTATPGSLVTDDGCLLRRPGPASARRAAPRAPGDRDARRCARRRCAWRVRARVSGASRARDRRGLPPRLLRRRARWRAVRSPGSGGAAAGQAGRRRARSCSLRPIPPSRTARRSRGPSVPAEGHRGSRARSSSSSAASRRCSSSGAASRSCR